MDSIKTCIRRLLFLRKEFPWTGWFSCETIECSPSCLAACLRWEYDWFWMSRCRLIETGLERCKMKKNASVTNNVRLLDVLFFPCSLPIRCDQLRLVGIWWIVKIWMELEELGWKDLICVDLDLGRIELRLTNTLNSHTGPRNAIQGSTDCCMNERTKDCRSQKKACWRKHLLASYSSSTAFAQLLEHPIQTERLCETMNFNNEFAGTSYQHSQSTSTWP